MKSRNHTSAEICRSTWAGNPWHLKLVARCRALARQLLWHCTSEGIAGLRMVHAADKVRIFRYRPILTVRTLLDHHHASI